MRKPIVIHTKIGKAYKLIVLLCLIVFVQGCVKQVQHINFNSLGFAKIKKQIGELKEASISGNIIYNNKPFPLEAIYKKTKSGYVIIFFNPYMEEIGEAVYDGKMQYKFVQKFDNSFKKVLNKLSKVLPNLIFGKVELNNTIYRVTNDYIYFKVGKMSVKMDLKKLVIKSAELQGIKIEYKSFQKLSKGFWIAKKEELFYNGFMIAELMIDNKND